MNDLHLYRYIYTTQAKVPYKALAARVVPQLYMRCTDGEIKNSGGNLFTGGMKMLVEYLQET